MRKGFFFDLDGVVFNTEPLYSQFWGEVGKRLLPGIPDFAKQIKGQTLPQILDTYFSDQLAAERDDVVSRLNDFEAHMDFPYVPGFLDFIMWLDNKGADTALVTSSNQMKMAQVYRRYPDFKRLFKEILTAEDFNESKPSPDPYLKAAERFALSPEECVGFEDSFNGLKSLRAAGMKVVGLATTNPPQAIGELADYVISDYTAPEALVRWLETL